VEERSGVGVDRLGSRLYPHRPVEDDKEGGFLDAVVAERLTGTQLDEHGPLGALARMENDG
jgi:hypothetical protein